MKMYATNIAAQQHQQQSQQQQQQQPMIIMQPAAYHQQANFSNSLMSLCCGVCRKNPPGSFAPQTQLLNPSVSNNYLYQQHFQHLQQPKQQRLQQQQQQHQQQQQQINLTTQLPVAPAPQTSSYVPGCGGQQRYVGGMVNANYVQSNQQQPQPQLTSQQQQPNVMSPSKNVYGTITNQQQQHQYGKQQQPMHGPYQQHVGGGGGGRIVSDMMVVSQPDSFRRVSGLTSDVFRQIEQVEQQFDPNSLASTQYAEMERRGEMIIRILSPTQILPQWLDDMMRRFGDGISLPSWVQFVEIIKRPGQTLGLYIREGDGLYTMDGVYISRIALESPVYQSGCLRVGDEVLAINFVDVSRMSLDDVVLIMSIPRRLILTIRSRPLNAEHMLTNRNIYGTGMSDSCYYDTVAGSDIYSRVDDLRSKPVVVVKQQPNDAALLLDEEDEEEVLQAASAAAEAGLLDDPSTAAAAAVAALQDPTPAKAAAAVAAVNEIMVRSGSSLDIYGGSNVGSRPGSSLMLARSNRGRRLFTSDNLADLYQSVTERAMMNNNLYANLPGIRHDSLMNQKPMRTPLSSLYHGRLTHHGSRSRSATGRLMRTSSEQMIYGGAPGLHQDPAEQIDHFLQRYQSAKQNRGHRLSRNRHHSLDHSAIIRNSFSTQSLAGSQFSNLSNIHGMAIPLPGMAEAVAIARRRYLRGEINNDENNNLIDGSYSDTEQYGTAAALTDRSNRSNSLPRAPGLGGRLSSHHHNRNNNNLSNRLQQLEQFYSSKNRPPSSTGRPRSAMAGGVYNDMQDGDSSTIDMITRMRRQLASGQNKYPGQSPQLMSSARLDSLRASLVESSDDALAKNRSSSRNAANAPSSAASTSAIYETIRKSKMAQDLQQPQSGRLALGSGTSTTDDMKSRYSNLQMSRNTSDYHRPPFDDILDGHNQSQQQQQMQQISSTAASSLIGQISTRPSRTLMIDPSGFQQYGPDLQRQAMTATNEKNDGQIAGYSGLLVIHLLGVRGLQLDHLMSGKNANTTSTATPMKSKTKRVLYSVVECDRIYKARTVAVQSHDNNSTNFDWDEVFDIDLFDTKEVSFLFYTWDQSLPDLNMRHKQCSKGTIHLPSIHSLTTQHVHAFELRLYDTPGAMFYIKLEYHDLLTTFKRTKRNHFNSLSFNNKNLRTNRSINNNDNDDQQPLFGVDLETVILRESTGTSIPIIIKRCCEEIEQRGLHMLGIYRLCGSSLVKRTLRESFEKNPWTTDISAENVPDINVITSLLKDYLRELPEPLFNKAMFDMMDDGISVCVPDDPAGNAKLMFSILECLPKSHRNTVLYLMDHIKLIHLNSDRNKMTSQALAICFGPLFSCHDQSDSVYKPIQVFKFLLDIWPRRKGSFNMLNKLDVKQNPSSSLIDTAATIDDSSAHSSINTTTMASIRSPSYRSPMNDMTYNNNDNVDLNQHHLYESPPDASYKFQSNTENKSPKTTTTTNTTTWSSNSLITKTSGGTGRLLPSTQNATRTISTYSSTSNSKYRSSTGYSSIISTTTATTSSTTSSTRISSIDSILSTPYRSRYGLTSSTISTTTTTVSTTTTTSSNLDSSPNPITSHRYTSDYYSNDTSLGSSNLSSLGSPYLSSSLHSSSYGESEVIDQTYKKYLNPSTTSTTSTSGTSDIAKSSTSSVTNEGLYSTVRKTPISSIRSKIFDDDDDDILSRRHRSSYLNDTSTSSYQELPTKPLITGSGPSSTQLYPSRLNSTLTSTTATAITTGYSSLSSSLYSRNNDDSGTSITTVTSTITSSKFAPSYLSSSMVNHKDSSSIGSDYIGTKSITTTSLSSSFRKTGNFKNNTLFNSNEDNNNNNNDDGNEFFESTSSYKQHSRNITDYNNSTHDDNENVL